MLCSCKCVSRHVAPGGQILRRARIGRPEFHHVARLQLHHALKKQQHEFAAAHVSCVPFLNNLIAILTSHLSVRLGELPIILDVYLLKDGISLLFLCNGLY